jgi:choline dehydrogenase-like flavoprotein
LQDAVEAGAELVVNCKVEKVLIENGRAVGVSATSGPSTGLRQAQATVSGPETHTVTVRAKKVVVAAGALHSPALLLRSGIENPNIGLNLRLHPTTAVRGELAGQAEPWRGVMMGAYSDEWGNLDGAHYGVKIETPPAHPGLLGFALPWLGGRTYKDMMLKMARQAIFIVLCRDRGSGQITVDKNGRPRIHYQLHKRDAAHLQTGIEGALRIAVAAGADEVGTLHAGLAHYAVNGDAQAFEAYLAQVRRAGTRANHLGLFSAHQMGTCRMGGERHNSVVTHLGESWDVRGLYVADASTFPTPSGVNPMITIEAVAYTVAQGMR